MATTIATMSLSSNDLLTDVLALSTSTSLTKAGNSTGLTLTSGLGRKTTSAAAAGNIQAEILFRGDDATTNGANKVYLNNISTNAGYYYTIHIDGEELGRLYGGDWAFFPWNATAGTKASFTLTIAGAWVAGDTWEFDGVKATATNTTEADFCAIIDGTNYPNWTTDHNAAGAEVTVAFTARQSGGLTQSTAVTADGTKVSSNGTSVISSGAAGTGKSESDISVRPSVHNEMTIEYMLLHQ